MDDLERAVAEFLDAADDCFAEYEQGYQDADATLRRLEPHLADLRETHEDATSDEDSA